MRKAVMTACVLGLMTLAALAYAWFQRQPSPLSAADLAAQLSQPLRPPQEPIAVYHLGHSLVSRNMPQHLAQMAGHEHASQLGWGATLKGHWTGDLNGFAEENAHPAFRPALEAIDSGDYPVVVLTEMVELKDAIRYFDSPHYLGLWAARARQARPDVRLYLYETWHPLDDPTGWLARIKADRQALWENTLLAGAMARPGVGPIYIIPGGQVMAATARAIEAAEVPHLQSRDDLFALNDAGERDTIHFNEIGAYLMALTHYAVIYQQNPADVLHELPKGLAAETAQALQHIVWRCVRADPFTGLSQPAPV